MYFLIRVYASMHPIQPNINLYVFSFKSLCIYTFFVTIKNLYVFSYKSLCISAMLASYSVVNKICIYFVLWVYASMLRMHPMQPYTNFFIFCSMSLYIYATHASYAALYKLLYILFYESMHLCYACIPCSLIQTSIYFVLWVYASMLCMHPMFLINI